MQKIDFVNATHPAINDTNLNLMQDNIETAINAQVSGDTLPLGAMIPFPGGTIPDNYLLCDGSAVSRTTYALLFNVIGTTYGAGDGSTTFNVPNLKGKVPVGYDSTQSEFDTLGETGGEKTHILTTDEMPAHKHSVNTIYPFTAGNNYTGVPNSNASSHYNTNDTGVVNNTGGGQAHNNLQPYLVMHYIIKAFQTAGTVAQILNTHSASTTDGYSCNYINSITDYSTTEKICGYWVDGKPIYRKVFTTTLSSSDNEQDKVISNSVIANFGDLVSLKGNLKNSFGNWFPISSISPNGTLKNGIGLFYNATSGVNIRIGDSSISSNSKANVIIEYTKTTD